MSDLDKDVLTSQSSISSAQMINQNFWTVNHLKTVCSCSFQSIVSPEGIKRQVVAGAREAQVVRASGNTRETDLQRDVRF